MGMNHQQFIEARLQALITLDLEGAKKLMSQYGDSISHLSDEGIVLGLHKARLHVPEVPLHLRQESLAILKAHGFKDVFGNDLPERIEE